MYLKASNPWNPGYALPSNVMDEPFARGTITTAQTRRKTISALLPSEFVGLSGLGGGGLGSLGGHTLSGHTLKGSTLAQHSLAGSTLGGPVGAPGDPVAAFGRDSARLLMAEIMTVAPADRKPLMKTLLNAIEPGMFYEVEQKATAFAKAKGYTPQVALEKALAAAFANRFLSQVIKVGKTGRAPTGGLLGLGACYCDAQSGRAAGQQALSGFWDNVGGFFKKAGTGTYGVGKKIVNGIGKLACKAANSGGLLPVAAAAGGSVGAAGAASAGVLCTPGDAAQTGGGFFPSAGGGMLPLLLIGGGALAVVLVATRRGGKK